VLPRLTNCSRWESYSSSLLPNSRTGSVMAVVLAKVVVASKHCRLIAVSLKLVSAAYIAKSKYTQPKICGISIYLYMPLLNSI